MTKSTSKSPKLIPDFYSKKTRFVEELGYRTRIEYHPWIHDHQVAGFTKFYDKQLTFATIRGAGHMVPEDKPAPALQMFNDFLGVHK